MTSGPFLQIVLISGESPGYGSCLLIMFLSLFSWSVVNISIEYFTNVFISHIMGTLTCLSEEKEEVDLPDQRRNSQVTKPLKPSPSPSPPHP